MECESDPVHHLAGIGATEIGVRPSQAVHVALDGYHLTRINLARNPVRDGITHRGQKAGHQQDRKDRLRNSHESSGEDGHRGYILSYEWLVYSIRQEHRRLYANGKDDNGRTLKTQISAV
jgi:hypothetical protein